MATIVTTPTVELADAVNGLEVEVKFRASSDSVPHAVAVCFCRWVIPVPAVYVPPLAFADEHAHTSQLLDPDSVSAAADAVPLAA
jgi:hypothetical protein